MNWPVNGANCSNCTASRNGAKRPDFSEMFVRLNWYPKHTMHGTRHSLVRPSLVWQCERVPAPSVGAGSKPAPSVHPYRAGDPPGSSRMGRIDTVHRISGDRQLLLVPVGTHGRAPLPGTVRTSLLDRDTTDSSLNPTLPPEHCRYSYHTDYR